MARLSEAPMRVCTASSTCSSADSAGTRLPTYTVQQPVLSKNHANVSKKGKSQVNRDIHWPGQWVQVLCISMVLLEHCSVPRCDRYAMLMGF